MENTTPTEKIINVDIEKEVKKSFLEYAMSCIVSRALPDVRDGLKPVHRRIIYTMGTTGLTPDAAYRKSVTAVGDVLGKYHPHGDASVYDAMVRMAQDFSYRYVLVDGHGNFGSVDGDPPAAFRYTEAKMSKLAVEMMRDIDRDTVDFMPNFDGRLKEPTVLPSRFPNLLVNGSMGISVGFATNIPPHNLGETIDAALCLLDDPEADMEKLMQYLPGPDFPTSGIILGHSGIRAMYATGKGYIRVRSKAEIEEMPNGRSRIVVTEIPYMVNKSKLVESIAELAKDKRVEGSRDIRDESSRAGLRVVIDLGKDVPSQVVLNQLYKYTQLEDTFAANMLALVNSTPRVLPLKTILQEYIAHQRNIIVRRTRFDLKKALDRAHILEGLRIAVDHIDEVVRIIRASSSVNEAKLNLMERFSSAEVGSLLERSEVGYDEGEPSSGLTEIQAAAIVAMTLGQLTGLGVDKIEKEYAEKMAIVKNCREILASDSRVREIIRDEMTEIKKKYGDERRTQIEPVEDELDIEDLIKEETCVYTLSGMGYIKRIPAAAYRAQRRGGRGVSGMSIREEDAAKTVFVASTHDEIIFFTTAGRAFRLKGYRIPEASRTARGTNLVNLLRLDPDEKVTVMHHCSEFGSDNYLTMVTANGTVKRLSLAEMRAIRPSGIRMITLDEGDRLINVLLTDGNSDILIGSKLGQSVRFRETDVRAMGRMAGGVRGIRLAEDDEVIGAVDIDDDSLLMTVTANGFGKITRGDEFPVHNRGGKGVVLHGVTDKTGTVSAMTVLSTADDIMLITSEGTVIRTSADTVRICGRPSQGVIVMRVQEGEEVIAMARLEADVENDVDNVENTEENPASATENADENR
ncbi:MAG: DNA gyrase subunit A [Clostridia bacterium]|nr:DNA gyrase subunit A [Clostridia bacterium]